eukprot:4926831-Amphidinium_carterae.1
MTGVEHTQTHRCAQSSPNCAAAHLLLACCVGQGDLLGLDVHADRHRWRHSYHSPQHCRAAKYSHCCGLSAQDYIARTALEIQNKLPKDSAYLPRSYRKHLDLELRACFQD